jgi:para-aminobenzoate synthetase component 1
MDRLISERYLNWLCFKWSTVCYLNSNDHGDSYIALAGEDVECYTGSDVDMLRSWLDRHDKEWAFGYLGYDLKNQLEELESHNEDRMGMPDAFFFVPEVLIKISENDEIAVIYGDFDGFEEREHEQLDAGGNQIHWKETKEDYIKKIEQLQEHIQHGDIYEVNYCHEFYMEKTDLNPCKLYEYLNELTQAPFSVFLKHKEHSILCASPERFVKRSRNKICSQPMKGTVKRDGNKEKDMLLKSQLEKNPKERSENIMIVDLVRNDLSKIAKSNSVKVDELCKVYSFKTVHQMISTVSAEIDEEQNNLDVLLACFPMGSMTGAPKVRAMKLIEKYEATKRGLYSGSIGYFDPNNDFDFNVVIRSIILNSEKKCLSAMVGGAITSKSVPEDEYEETKLKANALILAIEKCIR